MLFLTSACAFLAFLDVTIVNIAFPDIRAAFHDTSLPTLSWVLNAYNVLLAALLVPAGRWADALGRRRVLLLGLGLFLTASLICGASPGVAVLIAGRCVQALGAALLVPSSVAILLHSVAPSRRVRSIGLWAAAGAVAAAVGPPLGGVLVDLAGWRAVFLVNVPLTLLVGLAAARWLPESRDPAGAPGREVWLVVLLALSFGLAALALVEGQDWGWTSGRTIACFVGSVDALLGFLVCSWAQRSQGNRTRTTTRSTVVANVGTLLFSAAFYGLLLNYVLFLTGVWHYGVLQAGVAMAPGALSAAAAAGPAGRAAERYGHRLVALLGCLVYVAGCLLFVRQTGVTGSYLTDWLPCFVLTGAGTGMVLPNLLGAALAPLPQARLATGSSINAAARQVGGVLGVAVVVAVLNAGGSATPLARAHRVWVVAAVLGAVVGMLAFLLRPEPVPGEAIEVLPGDPGSASYRRRYLLVALPSVLRRHRLSAASVGCRYSTTFSLPAADHARWQDLFGVRTGAAPPLAYHSASGTLALMRLLADTGLNFRFLLHLQTESRRPEDADPIEPYRTYDLELRLAAIVRLSGSKVGLVVDNEVRSASGQVLQQNRDTFLIRRVSKALAAGLPAVAPPPELDLGSIAGYQPSLSGRSDVVRRDFDVPDDLGHRYGEVSGDRNVVHTTWLAARLFGYRKPFVQGLCTSSMVTKVLTDESAAPLNWWRITFCHPVYVGQQVTLHAGAGAVELHGQNGRLVAFGEYARHAQTPTVAAAA